MVAKKTSKKTAAKEAPKKTTVAQTNVKTPQGSPEFLAELTDVFKRHGWSGLPRELSFSSESVCDRVCDDGSIAQPKTIKCPGGRTKVVCACPGEDPTCED
jgi:hypothetical protein